MLHIVEHKSYEEMSRQCAEELVLLIKNRPKARIVLATGASPLLAYRIFVQEIIHNKIDVSDVIWIKLDEWAGMSPENPASCEYFINQEILTPLHIKKENYISFGVTGGDLEEECKRVETQLEKIGKIDAAIVGIGRNGHVGLNEPSNELTAGIHLVNLDEITKTHRMLTSVGADHVEQGITMGMDWILSADRLIVLATGQGKGDVYRKLLQKKIMTTIPATLLQLHGNAVCYADMETIG